jgi:hypothetical protein
VLLIDICGWFLVKKKEYIGIFVFFDRMCTTLLICISNHVLFVSSINAYKCHIINFLLTSLAGYMCRERSDFDLFVQTSPYGLGLYKKDLGPIFFCTDLMFGNARIKLKP